MKLQIFAKHLDILGCSMEVFLDKNSKILTHGKNNNMVVINILPAGLKWIVGVKILPSDKRLPTYNAKL